MTTLVQKFSTIGVKLDTTTTPNKRAKLDTGKLCNYKCEFCYYKNQLDQRDSLEQIFQRVDYIWKYGIREIELSGGESSVEPNWFKILEYCKTKGFTNISTLSNGSKFANIIFLQKSKEKGLNEILFSLHGYDSITHEKITGIKGSFEKILKAIKNAKELDLVVRINCTVYDINYEHLHTLYAKLIQEIQPLEINFIALKYNINNNDFRKVDYNVLTESIKRTIDVLKNSIKYINVRFVPFCYMNGYERYNCNHYQHIYDIFDWNRALYNQQIDVSKQYSNLEKLKQSYQAVANIRINDYHKEETCRNCRYFFICDGIDKKLKGTPLIPVPGEKILDVNYFRKNFYE